MKAVLICYTLGKANHKTRSKFKREFFGYDDKSNKGKYRYTRLGLLHRIPNSRPVRSVVIVRKDDGRKVKRLLRKHGAMMKIYSVDVKRTELK